MVTENKAPQAPTTPAAEAPAEEMVPKKDLLRTYGELGGWKKKATDAETALAQARDELDMLKRQPKPVSDEERAAHDRRDLDLRAKERALAQREAEITQIRRSITIDGLLSKYPLVKRDELEGQADADERDLRAFAVETHFTRQAAQTPANGATPPARATASTARVDTPGAGSPAAPPALTSRQKREQGMAKFLEQTAGTRQAAGLPS